MRHLVVVKAEVVAELVDHRLTDLRNRLIPRAGDAVDRSAKYDDLARQRRRSAAPLSECDAAIDSEQLYVATTTASDTIEIVDARLVLDRDGHVFDQIGEALGQRIQRVSDRAFEFGTR